jgi:V/A-type H+/Na+-transporting ATPase subunit K
VDTVIVLLGWAGIFSPLALAAIGSIIGSTIAGQAACGALLEIEGGYGRFIGLTALPSSQTIYGIVVMFALNRPVTVENAAGLAAIGCLSGLALLYAASNQGKAIASAISAAKAKPEIFGLSIAPAAIVEGFAVFVFVFALVLAGGLPG